MGELRPLLLPEELCDALAAEAASDGLSLEALAAQAVEAHLEAIKTRKFFEARAAAADPGWLINFLNRSGGNPPRAGDELPEGYEPKH